MFIEHSGNVYTRINMCTYYIINTFSGSIISFMEPLLMILLAHGQDVPVHTALGWKMRGPYKVKDGEKPIQVKLWKMRTGAYLYCREQIELME